MRSTRRNRAGPADHGYPDPKTNDALEAIAPLKLSESDYRHLAVACADRGGLAPSVMKQLEQLLALDF